MCWGGGVSEARITLSKVYLLGKNFDLYIITKINDDAKSS